MSDLVDRLRQKYPETPHHRDSLHSEAADRIEQLERVLAQALATLKDGDMDMVHATIAAIDEALNDKINRRGHRA